MTLKLTREQAQGILWGEDWPELGLTVELNEQTGSRRWVSEHRLIIKDKDGKFWAANYEQGLTEYQEDCKPFMDEPEVTFSEVEKVPVTTYEYRPKSAAATLPERHPQVTFTNAITSCPTVYQRRCYPTAEAAFEAAATENPYNNTRLSLGWCTQDHDATDTTPKTEQETTP